MSDSNSDRERELQTLIGAAPNTNTNPTAQAPMPPAIAPLANDAPVEHTVISPARPPPLPPHHARPSLPPADAEHFRPSLPPADEPHPNPPQARKPPPPFSELRAGLPAGDEPWAVSRPGLPPADEPPVVVHKSLAPTPEEALVTILKPPEPKPPEASQPHAHVPVPQGAIKAAPPPSEESKPPSIAPVPGTKTPSQITGGASKSPSQITGGDKRTPSQITGADKLTQPNGPSDVLGPGTRVHHYELIKLIGRGGMGSVYLARDVRLGRRVAIKFLHTQSEDLAKRFILEARTTAACSHENIVVIFEVDAWQGSPFMVFEYIHGQQLTRLIPEGKPLPPPRAVELMVPVVRALAFAHTQGIVHRDLKPDNIMVTDSGITKVLDFGIAKVLQGDEKAPEYAMRPRAPSHSMEDSTTAELTGHGAMMGTLAYMAPEQWGIGIPIDHRADIWSAGIMLFKMLSGKHPLDPLRGQQLMVTGLLNEPMPKLLSKAPEIPAALAEAVDKCLLKRKEQRWPDAVSLLRALEPFLPGRYSRELKIDESPYAGLSSFQESDADKFFGRAHEVAAMVNKIRERPIVGVVGPSGAGKSSFVRAGLVPALKRSGEPWESLVLRPGRSPLAALAAMISPMVSTSVSVADELAEEKKLTERLAVEPGFIGSVLRSRARREKKSLLVFVDQFEELYTLVNDPIERRAFTACLSAIADDTTAPIRLVLSVRSDFLDRVSEDPRFMAELTQGLVFLTSPGVDGLRDAIVQPAEQAGYKFESQDIVDDMLQHLAATQGALPLLQFAAQQLWEQRNPAKKQLTRIAYEAIGGVAGALASHAEAVLARLNPASLPLVRSILLRLITPDRTRAIVSMEELRELNTNAAEVQKLVDELVQARLLVVQTGSGVATVEIVHESLLHSWPTLKRWLEESGEDAAFVDQLRTAARQWQQNDEDAHLLWRGELAEEAARFQRRNRGELTQAQKKFLEAVVQATVREARQQRAVTIGAVVVLSLLVAASAVALVVIQKARNEAQHQAEVANIAEAEAVKNLEAAQLKEKERAIAQAEATANAAEAQKAAAELRVKQQELIDALNKAEEAANAAKASEGKAVRNASEALEAKRRSEEAKKRADAARQEVQGLLAKEKDRATRLEEQLGSPVIDTLK